MLFYKISVPNDIFVLFLVIKAEINKKYCVVTRAVIQIYLSLCEQCQEKEKIKKKGLVVAPMLLNHMNSRCQVDLIDMQTELPRSSDIKNTILIPLKTETV